MAEDWQRIQCNRGTVPLKIEMVISREHTGHSRPCSSKEKQRKQKTNIGNFTAKFEREKKSERERKRELAKERRGRGRKRRREERGGGDGGETAAHTR